MNLIVKEYGASRAFMFDTIFQTDGFPLVAITQRNVALAEAMILNDSAYLKSSDVGAGPQFKKSGEIKYGGSTAYWMTKLKRVLIDQELVDESEYRRRVFGAVAAVDRDNSTHLNADGVGRDEIAERLLAIPASRLLDCLKYPDETNLYLIKYLSEKTHAEKRARENQSFASKFCHYACFYFFEGTAEQDNYSIYDNVMCKTVPLYLDHFGLNRFDLSRYDEYRRAVDSVIDAAGNAVSRNGFDHLLWYYFKGRMQ